MFDESAVQHLSLDEIFAGDDVYAHYARHLIETINNQRQPPFPQVPPPIPGGNAGALASQPPTSPRLDKGRIHRPLIALPEVMPIGIVGAGAAGMYAALIFDSLDIKYEILEATDRVGGRIDTYRFPQKKGQPAPGYYDYFVFAVSLCTS
jgi:hypothetical protein